MNERWPAIAFQGIFLAANVSFLLAGNHNIFILASTTIIMLLFAFQALSGNPRFMYLFPVDRSSGMPIPTPSLDTWILRVLIVLSILSFYIGVTGSYTLTLNDEYVGVNSPTLVTIFLPLGTDGKKYIIKNESTISLNKINIQGSSNQLIDGNPFTQLLSLGAITLIFHNGAWRVC